MSRFSRAWPYWVVLLLIPLTGALAICTYRGIQTLMAPVVDAVEHVAEQVKR